MRALDLDAPDALRDFSAIEARLAEAVARIDGALTRTRCHGDCHGVNARIAPDGRAVFFDFDDGGYGYLAYDLAVHSWGQVAFGRERHAMGRAFHAGYASVRPIATANEAAMPLFATIRHIWFMGEFASHLSQWGREYATPARLAREVGFLLRWERERLSAVLL